MGGAAKSGATVTFGSVGEAMESRTPSNDLGNIRTGLLISSPTYTEQPIDDSHFAATPFQGLWPQAKPIARSGMTRSVSWVPGLACRAALPARPIKCQVLVYQTNVHGAKNPGDETLSRDRAQQSQVQAANMTALPVICFVIVLVALGTNAIAASISCPAPRSCTTKLQRRAW